MCACVKKEIKLTIEVIKFQLDPVLAPSLSKEASILYVASNISLHILSNTSGDYKFIKNENVLNYCYHLGLLNLNNDILNEIIQDSVVQYLEIIEIINPIKGN